MLRNHMLIDYNNHMFKIETVDIQRNVATKNEPNIFKHLQNRFVHSRKKTKTTDRPV